MSKRSFLSYAEVLSKETPIVVIIDEYEMGITGFVGKDEIRLQENIDTLKPFYGTMKGMGRQMYWGGSFGTN